MSICPHKTWSELYEQMKARMDKMKFAAANSPSVDREEHRFFLDVRHFRSENIRIHFSNGFIIIDGSHPELRDGPGSVQRSFRRRIQLPEGAAPNSVEYRISCDGILTIKIKKLYTREVGSFIIPVTLERNQ